MLQIVIAISLSFLAAGAWAQETAEQIIEKSIQASGGRKVLEKLTSTVARGMMEIGEQHVHSTLEVYTKAPNKRLIVTSIEGFGEVRQGYDGQVAWSEDPSRGLRLLEGAELADAQREATFNAELKWRELYSKVELTGKQKVGEREAYVLRLTPSSGKPLTRFYDAENFLVLRQISTRETPQGPLEIQVDLFDYRDIGGGVKGPFKIKQTMPVVGEILITVTEAKNNAEIDDARFSPSRKEPAKDAKP
jgi:outer membrane lipoprotein-sorting protein